MSLKKPVTILVAIVVVVLFTLFAAWMFDTLSQLQPAMTPA